MRQHTVLLFAILTFLVICWSTEAHPMLGNELSFFENSNCDYRNKRNPCPTKRRIFTQKYLTGQSNPNGYKKRIFNQKSSLRQPNNNVNQIYKNIGNTHGILGGGLIGQKNNFGDN
ncbi:uncharacterized protein LOC142320173 [Lycorma delicatula]|uniref:uncharacterized protein LOC142320173 n=1 Tax=Lycorma delicatula TaxID=130591 RepID=UPI003F51003B